MFSIRKIINLKTLREKSTFHNGAIIIWIKYTGTIQISPEPRLFSISTIYNAFNFIFYPTLSIFYITTIIIFVWGVAHTPCVSGCLHPVWIPPPCGIHSAERGEAPIFFHFRCVLILIRALGASAMWPEIPIMSTISAIRRRRNLKFGTHVEHRGPLRMFGAHFGICPWLTP